MDKIAPKFRDKVKKAAALLKEAGCEEVYLFGSTVEGNNREGSDIDLAVKGCPSGKYFKLLGKLMLELDCPVDLIDLDRDDRFTQFIETEGNLIHVS